MIRDGDHLLLNLSQLDFNSMKSTFTWPTTPSGFSSVIYDSDDNLVTAYDDKQNAFPGVEWEAGVKLLDKVSELCAEYTSAQTNLQNQLAGYSIPATEA